jgi:pimeloyl-ACP methyl ester carboxylesterase
MLALGILILSGIALSGCVAEGPHDLDVRDAVRTDPPANLQPPASVEESAILSHGDRINGLIYFAGGSGPHPVVIFLHGYPGNERNLDLAQAVRRTGYDALYFDYRGSWGSGGTYSLAHGLEDTDAVLAWVRDPANIAKYHFDASRIALVGHSTGAWFALMTAAHEPPNVCVAAIAAENVGWEGHDFAEHPDTRTEALNYLRSTTAEGGPIRANPDELLDQMLEHAAVWDYLAQADKLKSHPLLLIAATRDTPEEGVAMHEELVDAIHRAGGKVVRSLVFDDDHPFSSHRLAIADALTHWLTVDCSNAQTLQAP